MDFITIDTKWLENKYNEFNATYFGNKLGMCDFGMFTTGKGSRGNCLGHFFLQTDKVYGKLRYDKATRKIFILRPNGERVFITYHNFYEECHPTIELNGNYRWTEEGAEDTLIHEMCHYYTYKNGWYPKQSHGYEFKEIAYAVSRASNGRFTIQRLATAEEMTRMELDSTIKAQNDKRLEKKIDKCVVGIIYTDNGDVRLTLAADLGVILNISKGIYTNRILEIKASSDDNLKLLLFANGYHSISRSYRFWRIQDKPIYDKIRNGNFEFATVYKYKPKEPEPDEGTIFNLPPKHIEPKKNIIPHFKMSTTTGNTIEYYDIEENELFNKIKERFPKWPDENIWKLIEKQKNQVAESIISKFTGIFAKKKVQPIKRH